MIKLLTKCAQSRKRSPRETNPRLNSHLSPRYSIKCRSRPSSLKLINRVQPTTIRMLIFKKLAFLTKCLIECKRVQISVIASQKIWRINGRGRKDVIGEKILRVRLKRVSP